MFKPIGSLIEGIAARSRVPKAILALQIRTIARKALADSCQDLDSEILEAVRVTSFDGKTLKITAPSLVCAELHLRSEGLKKEINKTLGKKVIASLRFRAC